MNLFEGLEKFGLDGDMMGDLFADPTADKEKEKKEADEKKKKEIVIPKEEDFLLDKSFRCMVCDKPFMARVVKASKVRRLEPDTDLRPRYEYVDKLKYDIISCPYCGYTSMMRYFEQLSTAQIKLIKEGVCSKFAPTTSDIPTIYTYEEAIDRYRLSLFNSVVKRSSVSEKAYTCLILSWLCRGKLEEMDASEGERDEELYAKYQKEELSFYEQAFEGLIKAVATELPPICGMDSNTIDLILTEMAYRLGRYDIASKLITKLLSSKSLNKNVKERVLDIKDNIIASIRKG